MTVYNTVKFKFRYLIKFQIRHHSHRTQSVTSAFVALSECFKGHVGLNKHLFSQIESNACYLD